MRRLLRWSECRVRATLSTCKKSPTENSRKDHQRPVYRPVLARTGRYGRRVRVPRRSAQQGKGSVLREDLLGAANAACGQRCQPARVPPKRTGERTTKSDDASERIDNASRRKFEDRVPVSRKHVLSEETAERQRKKRNGTPGCAWEPPGRREVISDHRGAGRLEFGAKPGSKRTSN